MKEQVIAALRSLDPLNEEHWTGQGLARVDVVARLASLPDLKRKDIEDVAAGFHRDTARGYAFDVVEPDDSSSTDAPAAVLPDSLQAQCVALQAELQDVQRQQFDLRAREVDLLSRIDVINAKIEKESPSPNTATQIQAYQRRQQEMAAAPAKPTLSPLDAALAVNRNRTKQRPQYPHGK